MRVFSFLYLEAPSCCEVQNTRALQKKAQKRGERERRRRSSHHLPPLLRARVPFFFFFFFFFSISSVLLPVFACAGESFGKQKQRERRCGERSGVCSFFSSYFFASLALTFLFCAALSLSLSFSASVLLRRVLVSFNETQQQLSSPPHKIKKVKALHERVCNNIQ